MSETDKSFLIMKEKNRDQSGLSYQSADIYSCEDINSK
jgi:hypothetical protein